MGHEQTNGSRAPGSAALAATCRSVSEELERLRTAVEAVVPSDACISFHFDDRLHVNIDVRDLNDLARAETLLPTIAGGIFTKARRSMADHHSFRHRLTVEVEQ